MCRFAIRATYRARVDVEDGASDIALGVLELVRCVDGLGFAVVPAEDAHLAGCRLLRCAFGDARTLKSLSLAQDLDQPRLGENLVDDRRRHLKTVEDIVRRRRRGGRRVVDQGWAALRRRLRLWERTVEAGVEAPEEAIELVQFGLAAVVLKLLPDGLCSVGSASARL